MAKAAPRSPLAPRLVVSVCDAAGAPVRVPGLAAWLAGIAPKAARGTVTIALVGDRRMRTLNRTWRGTDAATDVISFPSGADPGPVKHLGDLVISRDTALRQGRAEGHSLATELRVLALHGLLHLLGYDHERDSGRMARIERRLRRQGGLPAGLIERGPAQT
jgi:probable rRNA maturation factor